MNENGFLTLRECLTEHKNKYGLPFNELSELPYPLNFESSKGVYSSVCTVRNINEDQGESDNVNSVFSRDLDNDDVYCRLQLTDDFGYVFQVFGTTSLVNISFDVKSEWLVVNDFTYSERVINEVLRRKLSYDNYIKVLGLIK